MRRLVPAILIAAAGVIGARAFAAPAFLPHVDYDIAPVTIGVGFGDLDHDGDADLIAATVTGSLVTIFLNHGDGEFDAGVAYSSGSGPRSVLVHDWNHDGDLDVAVACTSSNVVTVLLGEGDGTLGDRHDASTGEGSGVLGIVAGDFDQDENLDIAAATANHAVVIFLAGNGDGTFAPNGETMPASAPHGLAVADLDGDGLLDLATANRASNSVSVLRGNGDGTFLTLGPFGVAAQPVWVVATDLNRDGHLDLVTANRGGSFTPDSTVSVLLADGSDSFLPRADFLVGPGPEAVASGDFDRDGLEDLAVVHVAPSGVLTILSGRGDGTFEPRVGFETDGSPRALAVADLDDDAWPDIATANYLGGSIAVLRNAGSVLTAVDPGPPSPVALTLSARPSVFTHQTRFALQGHVDRAATLRVFDAQGRLVRNLFRGELHSGPENVSWDGRGESGAASASGVYFARLESGAEAITRRVVLIR